MRVSIFWVFFFLVSALFSCGEVVDERVASGLSVSTSGSDDEIIAAFNAASNSHQVLSVQNGSLAGSSLVIPPGSLSIDLSVSVSVAQSIANSNQASDLGISNVSIAPAGPSVFISPSTTVEVSAPMQLSIPVTSSANLNLGDSTDNYVVVYQGFAVSNGTVTNRSGLIPRSEIIIQNGFAKFKTTKFGIFQVAKTSTIIERAIEEASNIDPTNLPGKELVGKWQRCKPEYDGGTIVRHEFEIVAFTKNGIVTNSKQEFDSTDTTCAGSPISSESGSGTYSVGAIIPDITPTNTVRKIDVSMSSGTETLLGIYYVDSTASPLELIIDTNDNSSTERPDEFVDGEYYRFKKM